MTNQEMLQVALKQSAIDLNCRPEDLRGGPNRVVYSAPNPRARRYLELPFFCNLVSYGSNIVASVDARVADFVQRYIDHCSIEHCFETPNLHLLTEAFLPYGKRLCFMAEYFLPNLQRLEVLPCRYPVRLLGPEEFSGCYTAQWSNALCEKRRELDRLAVAAYDGEKMIGMAGCSADCEDMWQIGIDVLPAYRRQGVASALTSRLAAEILARGKVPFYCAAWSNLGSVRNALKSGFAPAWVELTAIDGQKAMEMTQPF